MNQPRCFYSALPAHQVTKLEISWKDKQAEEENMQAKILLAGHIETIANNSTKVIDVNIKGIRKSKAKERIKNHIDYMREGVINE